MESTKPTVIFLHIGKTAGTSLRQVLHRQFPSSEILRVISPERNPARLRREETLDYFASLPEPMRRRPRLIEGHIIFGLHEFVPGPSTYITLLRNPVALTISQYNFVLHRPRHWLYEEATSKHMTLDEYVRSGVSLETDNSQVRAISGDRTAAFGDVTEEMLEAAKRNIEERFSVVGLTERFDESLLLLRRAFGWSNLYYVRANVARSRTPVPDATRELLEEQNRFDMELYRWAEERFERAVAADPAFEEELRRFRRGNSLYRPWGQLTYTYPRLVQERFSKKRAARRAAAGA